MKYAVILAPALGALFSVSALAADTPAPNFIRTESGSFTVSAGRAGRGPVSLTPAGSGAKVIKLKSHRFEITAEGKAAELAACGEPSLGPSCMEIEAAAGRYHFPPFDALYIGDEQPRIVFSREGKRTPLDLPMAAGRIRSIEVIPGGIRVVVFAQSSLGRRSEDGKEIFGVSHKGTFKVVEFAGNKVKSVLTVKEEPRL